MVRKKFLKKSIIALFSVLLAFIMLYMDVIYSYPDKITMFRGEKHNKSIGGGLYISSFTDDFSPAGNSYTVPMKTGEYEALLKIGGKIPVRKVTVNVREAKALYASGNLLGLRIFNRGLICIDTQMISGNGQVFSPSHNAGILKGDVILELNGYPLLSSSDVEKYLKEGENLVKIKRNGNEKILPLVPCRDEKGELKIGAWVRDSTAGIGTLTYFDSETNTFGALGHGINESDTGILYDVSKGTVEKSKVISVIKGKKNEPGEICGSFIRSNGISGTIYKNCDRGLFGNLCSQFAFRGTLYPIALSSQVHTGKASVISEVDEKVSYYDINILKTRLLSPSSKGMMIEITDPALLEKTGGIVQGMSGSPIIQDGRLIGAVTHVLINDPTKGYGIFIENMLEAS